MDILVPVGTKLPHKTLQKVEQFARKHNIVHKSSKSVNKAEALRRLIELALASQTDVRVLEGDDENAA